MGHDDILQRRAATATTRFASTATHTATRAKPHTTAPTATNQATKTQRPTSKATKTNKHHATTDPTDTATHKHTTNKHHWKHKASTTATGVLASVTIHPSIQHKHRNSGPVRINVASPWQNKGWEAWISVVIVITVVSTILVGLRIYARRRKLKRFFVDDHLVLWAMITGLIGYIMIIALLIRNLQEYRIHNPTLNAFFAWLFLISGVFYTLQSTLGRLSLLFTFRRLSPRSIRSRRTLILLNTLTVLMILGAIPSICTHLIPTGILSASGHLWRFNRLRYTPPLFIGWMYWSIFNALADLTLFFLPYFLIFPKCLLTVKERRRLYALWAFGVVVFTVSILRTAYVRNVIFDPDNTRLGKAKAKYVSMTYACVESNCVVIAAAIPALRPLFSRTNSQESSGDNDVVEIIRREGLFEEPKGSEDDSSGTAVLSQTGTFGQYVDKGVDTEKVLKAARKEKIIVEGSAPKTKTVAPAPARGSLTISVISNQESDASSSYSWIISDPDIVRAASKVWVGDGSTAVGSGSASGSPLCP